MARKDTSKAAINLLVDAQVKKDAQKRVIDEGTTLTAIIEQCLRDYAGNQRVSERPA